MVTVWYFALSWFKSFKDNKELYNCLSWNDLIEILFSSSHKSLVDFIEVRLTGLLREVKRINKHGYVLLSIVWDILLIKCLPHYWSSKMLTKKKRPTTTCTAQVWFKIWKKKKTTQTTKDKCFANLVFSPAQYEGIFRYTLDFEPTSNSLH